ncbi:MAG: hypothetical protein UY06_C0007G0012 [Candidatus Amesbacteria bacterium GW2011_GWA2_47_70]|nr:MAG: hypothetical protein UY06_C0007G0012 [Candidatus Amesbacteria bacterium GW2011_GWA2_47_70]
MTKYRYFLRFTGNARRVRVKTTISRAEIRTSAEKNENLYRLPKAKPKASKIAIQPLITPPLIPLLP